MGTRARVAGAVLLSALTACSGGGDVVTVVTETVTAPPGGAETASALATPQGVLTGTRFTSEELGFAVDFPPDWTPQLGTGGAAVVGLSGVVSPTGFTNNVNVLVEDLSAQDETLAAYTDRALAAAPGLVEGFVLEGRETTTLGGREAGLLRFSGRQGELALRFQTVFTLAEGRAYAVTYTADAATFDGTLPGATFVIDSFRLT